MQMSRGNRYEHMCVCVRRAVRTLMSIRIRSKSMDFWTLVSNSRVGSNNCIPKTLLGDAPCRWSRYCILRSTAQQEFISAIFFNPEMYHVELFYSIIANAISGEWFKLFLLGNHQF